MQNIDKMMEDGTFDTLAKRERLQVTRQKAKLEKNLGSIKDLTRLPSAIFVVDVQKEVNAVREANRLNIPVIAMVDTCCDPTNIDYVIPANDDAAKSIALVTEVLCKAIAEGSEERKLEKEKEKDAQPAASDTTEVIAGKRLRQRRERPARAKTAAVVEESAEETKEETTNE
jgi:small subunit ribosomal protein S2